MEEWERMTTLVLASAYLALLLLRGALALSYARTIPPQSRAALPAGSLTIVQPILSGDPLLESRLSANLGALPDQSFLWLIDDDDPEARRITAALAAAHPDVDLRVEICPPCPDAINPKLWKLRRAAEIAQSPHFCVLDDDTTLPASSAADLAAAADSHTVATGMPCYSDDGNLPSGLLAQFVNNNSAFTYLGTSRLLRPFTLNGMGYVMRREELAEIENFEPILHELTDDLALATLILRQGGRIRQSAAPLRVRTGVRSLAQYFQLMHRWHVFTLLLLRRQSLPVQMLIIVLHGLPPILLAALFAVTAARPASAPVLAAVLLLRLLVIVAIQRKFFRHERSRAHRADVGDSAPAGHDAQTLASQGGSAACPGLEDGAPPGQKPAMPDGPLHRPAVSILSELLQPVHLAHALVSRTVRWRSRRYRVRDSHNFSAV